MALFSPVGHIGGHGKTNAVFLYIIIVIGFVSDTFEGGGMAVPEANVDISVVGGKLPEPLVTPVTRILPVTGFHLSVCDDNGLGGIGIKGSRNEFGGGMFGHCKKGAVQFVGGIP